MTFYLGGVLAPNGDTHFVPHSATVGQKISLLGTVSTYSLVYTTANAYAGGVLAPNGDIHFIPYSAIVGQKISASGVVSTYDLINPPPIVYETLNFIGNNGNLTITNNNTTSVNIFKTSGSSSWDTQAYISTGFTAPVTMEFNKQASSGDNGVSYAMISWNADPTTDSSYSSLDYASYPYQTNQYFVYHNNSVVHAGGSWSTTSKFYLVYATNGIMYHYNGSTLLYSVNYGTGATVYLDTSFYSVNATFGGFSNIRVKKQTWNGSAYV